MSIPSPAGLTAQSSAARTLYVTLPQPPPLPGAVPPAQPYPSGTFYAIDSTRVSLREYWWGTRSPLTMLLVPLLKLFRIRLNASSDDPAVNSLTCFETSWDRFPRDIQER